MREHFITFFFLRSQETYIFHFPFPVASCVVPSSGGFAEMEQEGEEGIRNYVICVTFSSLPFFSRPASLPARPPPRPPRFSCCLIPSALTWQFFGLVLWQNRENKI